MSELTNSCYTVTELKPTGQSWEVPKEVVENVNNQRLEFEREDPQGIKPLLAQMAAPSPETPNRPLRCITPIAPLKKQKYRRVDFKHQLKTIPTIDCKCSFIYL